MFYVDLVCFRRSLNLYHFVAKTEKLRSVMIQIINKHFREMCSYGSYKFGSENNAKLYDYEKLEIITEVLT